MKALPFFRGLSWLIVLNLLVKPVWIFFIDRQVQNTVGYVVYGQYFAVLNFSFVFLFLADAGLTNMVNQRIANRAAVNTAHLLQVKLAFLLLYTAVCCFFAWLTHFTHWELLAYVLGIQVMTSLFTFLRNIITAHQYFTADAWFSVVDKIFMTLFCGAILYGLWKQGMTMVLFLRIQLACTVASVLLALGFVLKRQLFPAVPREGFRLLVRRMLPFAVLVLLMAVHNRLDGFLLERLHLQGALQAGIYASAYRLLDVSNMVGFMAASFLVPFIARHQNDRPVVEDAFLNIRHFLLISAIAVTSFCVMYAPWLQQLLYHSADPYHADVLRYCMGVLPAYFLVHLYGSVLTATARFRAFVYIMMVAVALNSGLNCWLIPSLGAMGCCLAALVSQYVCGFACMIVATRSFRLPVGGRSIAAYGLSLVLLLTLFYVGKVYVTNVWVILAMAALLTILLLATQISHLKKYIPVFQ